VQNPTSPSVIPRHRGDDSTESDDSTDSYDSIARNRSPSRIRDQAQLSLCPQSDTPSCSSYCRCRWCGRCCRCGQRPPNVESSARASLPVPVPMANFHLSDFFRRWNPNVFDTVRN
jgi:hypothetical protein